jgi:hypothetical protein
LTTGCYGLDFEKHNQSTTLPAGRAYFNLVVLEISWVSEHKTKTTPVSLSEIVREREREKVCLFIIYMLVNVEEVSTNLGFFLE